MARAKQTNRADARRRYRQAVAADVEAEGTDGAAGSGADGAGRGRTSGAATTTAAAAAKSGRPGLLTSFRNAYHQPNYREDLRMLPSLVRGRWFLISVALLVVGFVVLIVYPSSVTLFAFQTLTAAPAVLTLFLVGFTAPRASYLLGLALAVIDVPLSWLGYGRLYLIAGQSFPGDAVLFYSILPGLPVAMVLASAAAWYRRFLSLTNPRRQQAGRSGDRSKPKKAAAARR